LGFCREESSSAQFGKPIILEHFRRKDNAIFILFCFYLFIWHIKHSMKIMRTQQCTKMDKKGYKEATNICLIMLIISAK